MGLGALQRRGPSPFLGELTPVVPNTPSSCLCVFTSAPQPSPAMPLLSCLLGNRTQPARLSSAWTAPPERLCCPPSPGAELVAPLSVPPIHYSNMASTHPSIYPHTHPSTHPPIHQPTCPFVYPPTCPSTHTPIHLPTHHLSVHHPSTLIYTNCLYQCLRSHCLEVLDESGFP